MANFNRPRVLMLNDIIYSSQAILAQQRLAANA